MDRQTKASACLRMCLFAGLESCATEYDGCGPHSTGVRRPHSCGPEGEVYRNSLIGAAPPPFRAVRRGRHRHISCRARPKTIDTTRPPTDDSRGSAALLDHAHRWRLDATAEEARRPLPCE